MKRAILTILLLILAATSITGQTSNPFNQRDDQYRLLGLKRAKELYEVASAEYERQKELFSRGMITQTELDRAKSVFSDAEVNYQQSLLAVLFEKQYVSVQKAVKYQAADGRKHVRLTLANTSGGSAEYRKLLNIDDALFRSLQPDVINNVYVSILNDDGATISQPYEEKVPELRFGEPVELDFAMLQDVDAVTVYMIYGSGSQRNMKIFLQKDDSVNRVIVQSEQFSQEVELGNSASFDLSLELFSGQSNTFSLEVVNLPRQIGRFFKDPSGSARLSQVKFTETTQSKRAALEIALPDRPTDDVVMDRAIPFYVVVLPSEQAKLFRANPDKIWTKQELQDFDAGLVQLELIPRGIGELIVRSRQLYHSILPDGTVRMSIEIANEGSHRLDNIEIKADLPLNWTRNIEPTLVPSLAIGQETRVNLEFTPPADVAVGKYEVRLRISAQSNNRPVTSDDKAVTVEVRAEANIVGTTLIVLLLVVLVGGIVFYGIKLSRK